MWPKFKKFGSRAKFRVLCFAVEDSTGFQTPARTLGDLKMENLESIEET